MEPRTIVRPATEQDVAAALAEARGSGQAVVPVGGATMLEVGTTPARYDVALSTEHLSGVLEYTPADLTIVVQAGTTLLELNQALGQHGQFLPLAVPFPDRATVGGVLAANAPSLWRTAYGSARDLVIGMRMALPSGQIARSGGRVVKNVAGYDLAKLFIGSYGTLGVIVEAAFKIYPLPAVMHTLLIPSPEPLTVARQVQKVGSGLLSLFTVNVTLGQKLGIAGPAAIAVVGGTERAAADLARAVALAAGAEVKTLPAGEANALLEAIRDFPAIATAKIATRPTNVPLDDLAGEVLSYPAVGLTFVHDLSLTAATVLAWRQHFRGTVTLLDASSRLKLEAGVWGQPGPELALMRKVKEVFDPNGVMSPGRYYGGL